jgi:hypothetical protein
VPPEWGWVRPLASTCATGVGLGTTVSVDLCHRSGLEYLSHGFQTQCTIAARAGLKVRPKSTCVPGPWISDPRYGARVLRVLGPMVQSVKTTCSLVPLSPEPEGHLQLGSIEAYTHSMPPKQAKMQPESTLSCRMERTLECDFRNRL